MAVTAACASGGVTDVQTGTPGAPGGAPPASTAPAATTSAAELPVEVTRVRAFVRDGRVQAFVEGGLGDGCTRLQPITQQRTGNTIDISVRSRREGEICTMIFQYVNEWVALDGPFEPGSYTVRANDQTVQFRVVAAGSGIRIDPDPGALPRVE
jgi:hypothetical protein